MATFLQSIGYNSWVLPALLIIPVIGAIALIALSRRDIDLDPVQLEAANRTARIKQDDIVLFDAFGGGLTWGSALLRW